jgi:uncharacterized Zn finger protein
VRENAAARGRRYLAEGRLVVARVDEKAIVATCRGSGEVHDVTWFSGRGWACTCPARGTCSHLVALQLVTAVPRLAR